VNEREFMCVSETFLKGTTGQTASDDMEVAT
jgi:hypothetical protein